MKISPQKQAKIEALSSETLSRILTHLAGNEIKEPAPKYPLAGIVHIDGIGQVTVEALRAEQARRAFQPEQS